MKKLILGLFLAAVCFWLQPFSVSALVSMAAASTDISNIDGRLKDSRHSCSDPRSARCKQQLTLLDIEVSGYELLTGDRIQALAKTNMSPAAKKYVADWLRDQMGETLKKVLEFQSRMQASY